MKPKLTTTIITALLLMASVSSTVAQEKYEYGVVYRHGGFIYIATEDSVQRFVSSPFKLEHQLKKVNELCAAGWEVHNTSEAGMLEYYTYYLRRRIKE